METILGRIERIASRGGLFTWLVIDAKTGETLWSGGENLPVKSASLIKLFIQEIARDHADERVVYRRDRAVPFSLLAHLEEREYRVADLVTMMIALSDNTATNLLIDHLGLDRLSKEIAAKYAGTKLQRHMMDTSARDKGLENTTTAKDVVEVLSHLMANDRALSDLAEQHDRSLFLRNVDDEAIAFYHKTGSLEDQKADAGILEIDGKKLIVVAILDRWSDAVTAKDHLGAFFAHVVDCAKGECPWPAS